MGKLFFVPANSSILSVVGAHQHPELLLSLYLPKLPIPEVPCVLQHGEAPPGQGGLDGGLAMRPPIH